MKKSRLEQWDIGHKFDIDRQPVKEVNLNFKADDLKMKHMIVLFQLKMYSDDKSP